MIAIQRDRDNEVPTAAPAIPYRPSGPAADLYASDAYSWAMQQADALRRGDLKAVDWDTVIEEIESVGRSEKNSWESLCGRVLEHLLAIEFWSRAIDKVLRHWAREVMYFRRRMADVLDRNPGLKGQYAAMYASAWRSARRAAVDRLTEYEDPAMPKEDETRVGSAAAAPGVPV